MTPLENRGNPDGFNIIRDLQVDDAGGGDRRCEGADGNTPARKVLESVARRTWRMLGTAFHLEVAVREETLTEMMLLTIARSKTPDIRFKQAKPHEEARTGIDWELWIGSERYRWLRYAMQAKKLYEDGRYQQLGYKSKATSQSELLRRYCEDDETVIPLYCFYNYRALSNDQLWKCGITAGHSRDFLQLGVTVTGLENVQQLLAAEGSTGWSFENIHSRYLTVPVRCLVCCPSILRVYVDDKALHPLTTKRVHLYEEIPESVLNRFDSTAHVNRDSMPQQEPTASDDGKWPDVTVICRIQDDLEAMDFSSRTPRPSSLTPNTKPLPVMRES